MAFTVNDLHDMIEIMESNPIWKKELRKVLLGDDFVEIPELVRQLIEMNRKHDERFGRIETKLDTVERDTSTLKQDVGVLKQDVGVLKQDVVTLKQDVSYLKGSDLERRIRERPFIYLGKFIRRADLVLDKTFRGLLDDALSTGRITQSEADDAERVDALVTGKLSDSTTGYLAIELANTAGPSDTARAIRRAQVVQTATGVRTLPIVCGRRIAPALRTEIENVGGSWAEIDPGTPDVA